MIEITIDSILDNFLGDFPFFSDPIFLFNPSRIPSKEELLSGMISEVRYPLVDETLQILPEIIIKYQIILDVFGNTFFEDANVRDDYRQRIQSFGVLIRLIEIFYDLDETEKFNIVNEYFGIDRSICSKITGIGVHYIQDSFSVMYRTPILSQQQREFLDSQIDAYEIVQYFERALVFLGIEKYWTVEIDSSVLAIVHGNFTQKGGKIYVPTNYTCTYRGLLALIIHEIDGHCRQFMYGGKYAIYGPGIRTTHSEEILEGLAIFLEHSWNIFIFGENSIERSLHNFSIKYSLLSKEIPLQEFFKKSKIKNYFRNFRGFYNVAQFLNTKDFVYIQGLYKILKLKSEFGFGLFDLLYSEGVVNETYIRRHIYQYSQSKYPDIDSLIQQSSAFYILNILIHDKK